jgi:hypothetical protein
MPLGLVPFVLLLAGSAQAFTYTSASRSIVALIQNGSGTPGALHCGTNVSTDSTLGAWSDSITDACTAPSLDYLSSSISMAASELSPDGFSISLAAQADANDPDPTGDLYSASANTQHPTQTGFSISVVTDFDVYVDRDLVSTGSGNAFAGVGIVNSGGFTVLADSVFIDEQTTRITLNPGSYFLRTAVGVSAGPAFQYPNGGPFIPAGHSTATLLMEFSVVPEASTALLIASGIALLALGRPLRR